MSKKKRKKKEEQLDEFRKLNDKEGKGHPRYIFKKRGKTYKAVGITHGEHTDGKKNVPLTANPNPTDKKPAYVRTVIEIKSKDKYGNKLKGWKFNVEDKKLVDALIKALEAADIENVEGKKKKP